MVEPTLANSSSDEPPAGSQAVAEALRKLDVLERRLAAEPHQFDFYQLLRSIERIRDDLPRLGRARLPEQEPIRLGQEASLTFAPSAISGFEKKSPQKPGRLKVRFFGAFGPNGRCRTT